MNDIVTGKLPPKGSVIGASDKSQDGSEHAKSEPSELNRGFNVTYVM
jgi:hypothetical protein